MYEWQQTFGVTTNENYWLKQTSVHMIRQWLLLATLYYEWNTANMSLTKLVQTTFSTSDATLSVDWSDENEELTNIKPQRTDNIQTRLQNVSWNCPMYFSTTGIQTWRWVILAGHGSGLQWSGMAPGYSCWAGKQETISLYLDVTIIIIKFHDACTRI